MRDVMDGRLIEKAEERTKVLSLSSGMLLVYKLPDAFALGELQFVVLDGRLV